MSMIFPEMIENSEGLARRAEALLQRLSALSDSLVGPMPSDATAGSANKQASVPQMYQMENAMNRTRDALNSCHAFAEVLEQTLMGGPATPLRPTRTRCHNP